MIDSGLADLENLIELASNLQDRSLAARLLGYISGNLSRIDTKKGLNLYESTLQLADSIPDHKRRAMTLLNIGKGMAKLDEVRAEDIFKNALEAAKNIPETDEDSVFIKNKIKRLLNEPEEGSRTDKPAPQASQLEPDSPVRTSSPTSTNLILGLYNTYEKHLAAAHTRAIARASPLCWAYDLVLGVYNFPINDIQELMEKVGTDTSGNLMVMQI